APVVPTRIFAAGFNYRALLKERGEPVPKQPVIFVKLNSALAAPDAAISMPREHLEAIDYEGELAAVVGTPGRRIPAAEALAHVAGYTVANDLTARDAQAATRQNTLAKSLPGFAPLGPHLLTADEVADPQALVIETKVDGVRRQRGRTKDMVFSVARLVSYISEFVALETGDVIETGTPAGLGWLRKPPATLRPGQLVEVSIAPLGTLANRLQVEGDGRTAAAPS
ncbi:MAG: fumarylacetoacetate hydrolase family protein, partial [Candidatus Dormibacteria bacterium]